MDAPSPLFTFAKGQSHQTSSFRQINKIFTTGKFSKMPNISFAKLDQCMVFQELL